MLFDFTTGEFDHYYYNKYNKKRRIRYVVLPPKRGTVTVSITTEDHVSYDCKYHFVKKEEIYRMIASGKPLALDNIYVCDFDVTDIPDHTNHPLVDFHSSYSFWDGQVDFQHARFTNGDVLFDHATFGDGDTNFYNTRFGEGTVNFRHVNFGVGEVNCNYASFGAGDVLFHKSQFGNGDVSFVGTDFGSGDVNFYDADLSTGDLNFVKVKAERVLFIDNRFHSHTNLLFESVDELVIQECIIEKILKCDAARFEKLSFLDTANIGQIYLDWKENNVKNAIESGVCYQAERESCTTSKVPSEKLAKQFRMLKENFHAMGDYENEDEAYRAYMKHHTKHFPRSLMKVFGFVGGYGTKPIRVLISSLLTVLLFGLGYIPAFSLTTQTEIFSSILSKGLYFSAITFLTIGYGDIWPPSQGVALAASIEGFLGLFLMSYFTVAIVRKLLR